MGPFFSSCCRASTNLPEFSPLKIIRCRRVVFALFALVEHAPRELRLQQRPLLARRQRSASSIFVFCCRHANVSPSGFHLGMNVSPSGFHLGIVVLAPHEKVSSALFIDVLSAIQPRQCSSLNTNRPHEPARGWSGFQRFGGVSRCPRDTEVG